MKKLGSSLKRRKGRRGRVGVAAVVAGPWPCCEQLCEQRRCVPSLYLCEEGEICFMQVALPMEVFIVCSIMCYLWRYNSLLFPRNIIENFQEENTLSKREFTLSPSVLCS